jgi:hypothetical protein
LAGQADCLVIRDLPWWGRVRWHVHRQHDGDGRGGVGDGARRFDQRGAAPADYRAGGRRVHRDGDRIRLDVDNRRLDLLVEESELEKRRADWQPLPPQYSRGVLGKYAKLVGSASQGAVCG